jgi:hypothetical protein
MWSHDGRATVGSAAAKEELQRYLQAGRDALVWKLDGLSEYDVRRPLVPTGTNLLGLVKHCAGVEAGYLGEVFDRPFPEPLPWMSLDAERNADLGATADESCGDIIGLAHRVWEHADATIATHRAKLEQTARDVGGGDAAWDTDRPEDR